jgi:ATP-binding cassette subfamily B protein
MSEMIVDTTESQKGRVLPNSRVLAFIASYWVRRPWLLGASVGLTLVSIGFDLAMPWAAGLLVDAVAAGPSQVQAAWVAWALFVGVYLCYSLVRNASFRFWNPLAARNMEELTNEGFGHVQTFSADWHANNMAGATVRRLTRAMWGYDTVSDAVIMWLGPALAVLIGLSLMMVLRWPAVGLFALVTVIVYIVSNSMLSNSYVRPANLKSVAMDSEIGAVLADSITSNPTVKSFGAEEREEARLADVTRRWRLASLVTWTRFINVWLLQNLLLVGLQAGLTGLLLAQWSRGEASAGDVAFAITAFMLMSGYLRNIGENIRELQKGLDDVEDVARYAQLPPQVADAPAAVTFVRGPGEIVFDHATFRYSLSEEPLYSDFSLRIAPGERVALVGPTGAGKSTFVKLVQRLYDLQAGRILIDGQDVAGVSQASLRRDIAVVPQDPALFHRTIAENLSYARPDASVDEIELAARRARAHDFITRLPKGYQTLVGERGVKLSGGERQRVAIARAFLADAPILVLDEATSSLDVETERDVQAAMEELMVGRTTVVIAHRLSTIRGADRILVFEEGRVVEEGRHADLLRLGGTYARLTAVADGVIA